MFPSNIIMLQNCLLLLTRFGRRKVRALPRRQRPPFIGLRRKGVSSKHHRETGALISPLCSARPPGGDSAVRWQT